MRKVTPVLLITFLAFLIGCGGGGGGVGTTTVTTTGGVVHPMAGTYYLSHAERVTSLGATIRDDGTATISGTLGSIHFSGDSSVAATADPNAYTAFFSATVEGSGIHFGNFNCTFTKSGQERRVDGDDHIDGVGDGVIGGPIVGHIADMPVTGGWTSTASNNTAVFAAGQPLFQTSPMLLIGASSSVLLKEGSLYMSYGGSDCPGLVLPPGHYRLVVDSILLQNDDYQGLNTAAHFVIDFLVAPNGVTTFPSSITGTIPHSQERLEGTQLTIASTSSNGSITVYGFTQSITFTGGTTLVTPPVGLKNTLAGGADIRLDLDPS